MKKSSAVTNFGKRLARFRKTKGLTQQELGDMVGVSKRVIAYYEGETTYPPAHLIVPLSEALKVSTDELLGVKKKKEILDERYAAMWRRLKIIETFSEADKKALIHYVNTISKKNKAEGKTSGAA